MKILNKQLFFDFLLQGFICILGNSSSFISKLFLPTLKGIVQKNKQTQTAYREAWEN
jgi:hypothetical protein